MKKQGIQNEKWFNNVTMASRNTPSSEEEEAPDITNVREYSDFILYFVKSGKFQHHCLQDERRRKGVLSLLTPDRVLKLTKERRLSPVVMQLTPGEPAQRVYLYALVRNSKFACCPISFMVKSMDCVNDFQFFKFADMSLEELEDLVQRLNNHIADLSTVEKEEAVIDLIHNTGPRFIPGTRNVPFNLYNEDEEAPPIKNYDADGLPINDLEDEVIAVTVGKSGQSKRRSSYQSLPSTQSKLSEPRTDSEKSALPRKKTTKPTTSKRDQQHKVSINRLTC